MIRGWIVLLCFATWSANAQSPGPTGTPSGPWRDQVHWVPMRDAAGSQRLLYTRVCRPAGEKPARVVSINHGSPPHSNDRLTTRPLNCDSEAARWFLSRGYLVVAGLRRGYGETGGAWAEDFGAACAAEGYARAGRESARDIDAIITYATGLPFTKPDGAVVVGQSAGGWAADAYDSLQHPKVIAFVSMAGGRGSHQHDIPNSICNPGELIRAAGLFGATATTPMLWVYAANDSFFAPDVAAAMRAAFTAAGGKAELILPGPYDGDGHRLFFGSAGSAIWGPMIERYLAARGAGP
jgi:dienelactone hydrolase